MTTADDIFNAAPRQQSVFEIGDVSCTLTEMSVAQSVEWGKFYQSNKDNTELLYGYLLSVCCEQFKGYEPKTIIDKLSPRYLMSMGDKILELSGINTAEDKKKTK